MKSTNKMSNRENLCLSFLLILGNAMMALLTYPSEGKKSGRRNIVHRPDYINVRIKGILEAELTPHCASDSAWKKRTRVQLTRS